MFLESYFLEIFSRLYFIPIGYVYMSTYMKKSGFWAWPLYEWGGGVFKRFSNFFNHEKITVYLLIRSAFT